MKVTLNKKSIKSLSANPATVIRAQETPQIGGGRVIDESFWVCINTRSNCEGTKRCPFD
ncbi:hypothetical protein [Pseudoalteromonas viridis]|uniref:Uncharacterized protein n=1 Tax=Pseudoalteromonas viridis TaxID=339617 RepID=A0ABX7VDF8_9GAMM|nr:hypothetical protein [Pseudoalteromonas viridis]QTL37857.1 hypothetical protein J5X90_19130 [Pseudoalteromonas viridis]